MYIGDGILGTASCHFLHRLVVASNMNHIAIAATNSRSHP
jgi:hypothetical protein